MKILEKKLNMKLLKEKYGVCRLDKNEAIQNCEVININPDKESREMKNFRSIIISKVGQKRYKHLYYVIELLI